MAGLGGSWSSIKGTRLVSEAKMASVSRVHVGKYSILRVVTITQSGDSYHLQSPKHTNSGIQSHGETQRPCLIVRSQNISVPRCRFFSGTSQKLDMLTRLAESTPKTSPPGKQETTQCATGKNSSLVAPAPTPSARTTVISPAMIPTTSASVCRSSRRSGKCPRSVTNVARGTTGHPRDHTSPMDRTPVSDSPP